MQAVLREQARIAGGGVYASALDLDMSLIRRSAAVRMAAGESPSEAIAAAHPDLPLYLYDAGHAFVAPGAGHHADSARLAMLRTLKHFQRSGGARGEV